MVATTLPKFNPSNDQRVAEIKARTEGILDYLKLLEGVDGRCKEEALTHYELAAMWAVKSLFVPRGD